MIRRVGKLVRGIAGTAGMVVLVGACGVDCTLGIEPGLEVEVFDAVTNAPLAGEAVGRVYVGETMVDSLETYEPVASARVLVSRQIGPGRYTVRITREGYAPWEQADVIVRHAGGDCGGVMTRELQAALQPVN